MRLLIALFLVVPVSVSAQQSEAVTEADSVDLEQALATLRKNISDSSDQLADTRPNRTVVFLQRSLNGYLRFQGNSVLPKGLSDVVVEIQADGRLSGTGMLNLDETDDFADASSGVLRFLSGSLPVMVSVAIEEADRSVIVTVEEVQIGPVTVPTALAELLVQRYSVNESYPTGFDLSVPVALPAAVRNVQIRQGQIAIVTQ